MHDITEQVERLAMIVLLLLFGRALASGLLRPLGALDIVAAAIIVIQPFGGMIALIRFYW